MEVFGVDRDTVMANKDFYRTPAKRVNFGINYGLTEYGLHTQLEQEVPGRFTRDQCAAMVQEKLRMAPGVARYQHLIVEEALRTGEVRSMHGHKRIALALRSGDEQRQSSARREVMNHPIQCGAGGIIKIAMATLYRLLPDWEGLVYPVLQVHDSLVFERGA